MDLPPERSLTPSLLPPSIELKTGLEEHAGLRSPQDLFEARLWIRFGQGNMSKCCGERAFDYFPG